MSGQTMRGLMTFITDIRSCKSKDQEQSRVEKELAKIRQKFTKQGGLEGYHRKKYIWKLLYIYILGYEVTFGQTEAANLINSTKFSEKYTGYIATGILVSEHDSEIHKGIVHSIRQDLVSNSEINQSLAIQMIGAQAPKILVETLEKDIQKIAFNTDQRYTAFIRKKAILCLLRMVRKYPDRYEPKRWQNSILSLFESSRQQLQLGHLSSACSFLLGISQFMDIEPLKDLCPRIVKYLQKLIYTKEYANEYQYYKCTNPWLQVKLLRILQLFPMSSDNNVQKVLTQILQRIIKGTEFKTNVNQNNVNHGILFEAANLIIHYGKSNQINEQLKDDVVTILGIFIRIKEPNLKYLGLETMCKFSQINKQLLDKHLKTILESLEMNDISIKKRALDLMYLMCTQANAKRIVEELLSYSEDWADASIKEELVLKIAILAERYAEDLVWYVDVVIRLVGSSGDYVTDDIWFRIIQMIVGFGKEKEANKILQKYAVNKLFNSINIPHVHPTLLMIGAFVIAEYGEHLVEAGKDEQKLFDVLNRHFQLSSPSVRCMLLNAFAKLAAKFPELADQCTNLFEVSSEHFDADLQQRGIEYNAILQLDLETQKKIFAKQPTYSEDIQNSNPLLKKIYKLKLGNQKDNKDPTILREAQKTAQEQVQQFLEKVKKEQTQEEIQVNPTYKLKEYQEQTMDRILYAFCKDQIQLEGKGVITPYKEKLNLDFVNSSQIKTLLPTQNGQLFQNDTLTINYKSEFKEHMGQTAMQFLCTEGQMENINLMITSKDTQGMDFNISPVNYSQQNPSIIVQIMSVEQNHSLPMVQLFYDIKNGQKQKKVEFRLPVLVNKFTQPVNMPPEQFQNFYTKYSDSTNETYKKLDVILKSPAPSEVPIPQVLNKFGTLMTDLLNLKVHPQQENGVVKKINGVGQVIYKDQESGEVIKLPVMLQMEGYDEFKEELRLSLRGGSQSALQNISQLVQAYFSGQK